MTSSIRMDDELQTRLKQYAMTREVSVSLVVREAVKQYLDAQQPTPHELGEPVFGRFRSGDGQRSRQRKAHLREHLHHKHARP